MILNTKLYKTEDVINIAGGNETKLKIISRFFNTDITINGENIIASTNDEQIINQLEKVFSFLLEISAKTIIVPQDIVYILKMIDRKDELRKLYLDRKVIVNNCSGRPIYPKTIMQKEFIELVNKNDIVFASGSAGTGKTFLAVTMAVKMLKDGQVKRIILARPAVEAGESLGFLPGDLKEKIDPYLRPLYDSLYEMLGKENVDDYIQKGTIEIAPLAYMRGRTLDNACIILDEAQNMTKMQMKMMLSRLGYNAKMIITGDITQIDLPKTVVSGLRNAIEILQDINGIGIITFEHEDVIRHPLVQEILKRYDRGTIWE